jgi:hypothetical protein
VTKLDSVRKAPSSSRSTKRALPPSAITYHLRIGEDRFALPRPLEQQGQVEGGNSDTPAGKHPNEPDMVRISVKVEGGEKANDHHEDAEMDDKSPHAVPLGHRLNLPFAAS